MYWDTFSTDTWIAVGVSAVILVIAIGYIINHNKNNKPPDTR